MMYLMKEGKVAEYTPRPADKNGVYFDLTLRPKSKVWLFDNSEWCPTGARIPDSFDVREDALKAAMDYHETEGCALYLEIYPAPEKVQEGFIAQDADGKWWGYVNWPVCYGDHWADPKSNEWVLLQESPPNPFWRKTLR